MPYIGSVMCGRAIPLFLIAAGLPASTASAQGTRTTELRGRVVSRTEAPLGGAEVRILGDSVSATTDSAGRFVLRQVPLGARTVLVRRIGFQPQYLSSVFHPGEHTEVTIVLAPGAYQLPEVEVNAAPSKPLEYAYTTKYDEFFRRQRIGLGQYITRKDIDRRMAAETSQLLMGMRGVLVLPGAPGIRPNSVRLRTCDKASVWVDGVEVRPSRGVTYQFLPTEMRPARRFSGDPATPGEVTGEMLDRLIPLQIEMIEVYTGPAQMPAETVGNSCAAIMIWTR